MKDGERVIAALHGLGNAAQLDHRDPAAAGLAAAAVRRGSRKGHRLSATIAAPFGFGWMPSAMLSARFPATPSR